MAKEKKANRLIAQAPKGFLRGILVLTGLMCIGLAVAGIFLPLVPTVPFLLLASACFARSSERFHRALLGHPHLGPLILAYRDGAGIPAKAKATAIASIWGSIGLSLFLIAPPVWIAGFLVVVCTAVTIYLLRLPTRRGTVKE